jgi:ABC-type ATPase involved in cell division
MFKDDIITDNLSFQAIVKDALLYSNYFIFLVGVSGAGKSYSAYDS